MDEGTFYHAAASLMKAAARALKIDLEVHDVGKDYDGSVSLKVATEIAQRPAATQLDYLIITNSRATAKKMMETAHDLQIALICEGLRAADSDALQQQYPNWILEVLPDDVEVGRLLAEMLFKKAADKGLRPGIVGIVSGTLTTASLLRTTGIKSYLSQHKDIEVKVLPADWDEEKARRVTVSMLQSRPQHPLIVAINDQMSLGAIQALKEMGYAPGVNALVGGVDWLPNANEAIRAGELTVSIGGHITDGVRALLMLYDSHHQHPVSQHSFNTALYALAEEDIKVVQERLFGDAFGRLPFDRFLRSRSDAPLDFTMPNVITELRNL